MDNLFDVREVSDILGIKKSTVYDWVHRKKINFVKVGRLVKFKPQVIENFIEHNSK